MFSQALSIGINFIGTLYHSALQKSDAADVETLFQAAGQDDQVGLAYVLASTQ